MSQQSAFDRQHIEESSVPQAPGLLEQFNLPPAAISFIRKNQKLIWIVTGSIAAVVIAVALYNQYTDYQEEKALSALTVAMQLEGEAKVESLAQVADEFGSTSSGMWSRIEIAHIAAKDGDLQKAIQGFTGIENDLSADDPLMPLALYALGVLFEKNNEPDKAIDAFTTLSEFKGFEANSFKAIGRLYEVQGQKAKALNMYKKSIEPVPGEEASPQANPDKEIIQAKINALQN